MVKIKNNSIFHFFLREFLSNNKKKTLQYEKMQNTEIQKFCLAFRKNTLHLRRI